MTLLSSANNVLRYLRREEAAQLSSGNLEHQTLVGFLNDAADELLGSHMWSFLKRDDGAAFYPGKFSATTGGWIVLGSTAASLRLQTNAWNTTYVANFSTRVRSRIRFTGDSALGNTSHIVTDLQNSGQFDCTLDTAWKGTTVIGTAGFEIWSNEHILPTTVRQVLSVRHEEEPLQLLPIDKHIELDASDPRITDSFQDYPEAVYVGGYGSGTTLNSGTATSGAIMLIWPPPSADVSLRYSYIYRHSHLEDDADTWDGVPVEHVSLIESMALERAFDSNMERDAERAGALAVKNARRLNRLLAADGKTPNQRFVPTEIGRGGTGRHPNSRWASRTVDAP